MLNSDSVTDCGHFHTGMEEEIEQTQIVVETSRFSCRYTRAQGTNFSRKFYSNNTELVNL